MIVTTHVLLVLSLLTALAASGRLLLSAAWRALPTSTPDSGTPHRRLLALLSFLPEGFCAFAVASSLFYAAGFTAGASLRCLAVFEAGFMTAGLGVAGARWLSRCRHGRVRGAVRRRTVPRVFLVYAALVAAVGVSAFFFGRYPLFVSDDFGHITIINRMMERRTLGTPFLYMPDDVGYHTFFPWNGILAGIGATAGASALETFAAAKVFLSGTAVLSFLSFLVTALREERRGTLHAAVLCSGVAYAVLAPEVFVFHGVGDYRGASYVLTFQAARMVWKTAVLREGTVRHRAAFLLLMAAVALIHPVDLPVFWLMYFPWAACVNLWRKDAQTLRGLALLSIAIAAIALAAKLAFYSVQKMPLSFGADVAAYLRYYVGRTDYEFGLPLMMFALAAPLIARAFLVRSPEFLWWPTGALAATLLFGSANPLLSSLYSKVMSRELMERTMYAYPLAAPVGMGFAACALHARAAFRDRRLRWTLLAAPLAVAAVARQLWIRHGLNGEPSYAWRGSKYSLVARQPRLFELIASLDQCVVLSDLVTSAPITAISTNYTYTNRPWVEIQRERTAESLRMMQAVGTSEFVPLLCKNGVDVLVLNPDAPFEPARHARWVFTTYYPIPRRSPVDEGLVHVARVDGASVYILDRARACDRELLERAPIHCRRP